MLRSLRYLALVLLAVWTAWSLLSRERRRRIDTGFQRAATLISLAFVGAGAVMLVQSLTGAGTGTGQALVMIVVGLGLVAYQRWAR